MSLAELMPEIKSLPRSDKFLLVRQVLESLEQQEAEASEDPLMRMLASEVAFPIWSPFDAYDVANTLEELFKAEADAAK